MSSWLDCDGILGFISIFTSFTAFSKKFPWYLKSLHHTQTIFGRTRCNLRIGLNWRAGER